MIAYRKYLSPSGWNAISGIQAGHKALSADLAADCVIIGAGFAGLAAARRMAEIDPDQRIVLLDADLPGENSSGRNSGFMIHLPYAKISAGRDASRREWQVRLLAHGRQSLEQLIDQHQFRCGWRNSGHYKAAVTAAGVRTLDALRQTLVHHGLSFRCLEAREIAAELGTEHYCAALWLPSCTLVQPAELVHGLVQTLPGNVDPYFGSPVRAIHDDGHWTVETAEGTVRARVLLLCVNTQLPAFGQARYRQLTMYTYAALTRPLSRGEAAGLGEAHDWGLTPVERLEATSRKVQGNRLMLRTGFSYKHELEPAKAREALAHALSDRYPGMNPDCFEHVWGGAVSLTRNEAPILRRVGRQAYAVSGCNASGILKMTALGELLADLAAGRASALLEETLAMCKPAFIPPDPIRRIAVNINLCRFKRELKGNRDEHRPIRA